MDTKGGRFTLEINSRRFSGRGEATIRPARLTRENGVNMDGSGYSTVKPQLAALELTFDRGVGLLWSDEIMDQEMNVSFEEIDINRTHFFTGARFSGQPSINSASGEVSGLMIETDNYQVV